MCAMRIHGSIRSDGGIYVYALIDVKVPIEVNASISTCKVSCPYHLLG